MIVRRNVVTRFSHIGKRMVARGGMDGHPDSIMPLNMRQASIRTCAA